MATSRGSYFRASVTADPRPMKADTTKTFKQGQVVMRATVGGELKIQPALINTDGPNVVGVIEQTDPKESLPFGSEVQRLPILPVRSLGEFTMFGKSGQTYKAGDYIVLDETFATPDGQHVRLQGADGFANVFARVSDDVVDGGITVGADATLIPLRLAPPGLGLNSGTYLIEL